MSFDDHLRLAAEDLSAVELLVFTGISGSGKSRYLDWLRLRHRDYRETDVQCMTGHPLKWSRAYPARTLFIDELTRLRDAVHVRRLLYRGHRLVVASHLPPALLAMLCRGFRLRQYRTDADAGKLQRYLDDLDVSWDVHSLGHYRQRYGLSYTDAQIMLQHTGLKDLAEVMRQFDRRCRMTG